MRIPIDRKVANIDVPQNDSLSGVDFSAEIYGVICPTCSTELFAGLLEATDTYTNAELTSVLGLDANERRLRYRLLDEIATDSKERYNYIRGDVCCPICGEKIPSRSFLVPHKQKLYSFDLPFDVKKGANSLFSKLSARRQEELKVKAESDAQAYIDICSQTISEEGTISDVERITEDKEVLKKYVHYILNLESSIYELKAQLAQHLRNKEEIVSFWVDRFSEEIEKKLSEISLAEDALSCVPRSPDTSDIRPPQKSYPTKPKYPLEPVFSQKKPQAPEYRKPNLFNKKQVLAENEQKEAAYKQELQRYNAKLEEHNQAVQKYEKACASYADMLFEYEETCKKIDEEIAVAFQAAIDERVAEHNRLVQAEQSKCDDMKVALRAILQKRGDAGESLVNREIEKVKGLIKETVKTLNRMYSLNVVYDKYRNLVAIATFYDYLMSGRCQTLDGADGAYNIYENEKRSDIVISQLSNVLESLEKIQENQYMLYQKITAIDAGIQKMNTSMSRAVSELVNISANTADTNKVLDAIECNIVNVNQNTAAIADNTAITAQYTQVIAHYSEATAYYTKKAAELTDVQNFLIALS